MGSIQKNLLKLFMLCSVFFLLSGCQETGGTNFQTMLQNLSESYDPLWKMLTATAYILGFVLIAKALYQLKIYGENRSMSSAQSSIKAPLSYIGAGAMLIFSPAAFNIINVTFFGSTNPLSYTGGSVGSFSQASIIAVIGVVQLIGLVAFIKGWLLVARASDQGGQPGQMGKAFTHIVGGAFAINVVQVKDVIWNTFGFG